MTRVTVRTASGRVLGEREVVDSELELTAHDESLIWGDQASELARACARLDALNSGVMIWKNGEPACMENGDPITPEILQAWGWRQEGDRWVRD